MLLFARIFKGVLGLFIALAVLLALRYYAASGWGNDYPSGRLTPDQHQFRITSYRLDIHVNPQRRRLKVRCLMGLRFRDGADTVRLNFVEGYHIKRLRVDGREVDAHYANDYVWWTRQTKTNPFQRVELIYEGAPLQARRAPWRGGFVWRKDEQGMPWMGLACQGEGGKIWLPARDGAGIKSDTLMMCIKVPRPLFAAASGHLLKVDSLRDSLIFHWRSFYPILHYNINFTIGHYVVIKDTLHSVNGRDVAVRLYALKGDSARFATLLKPLKKAVHFMEQRLGAYPWPDDKIGLAQTPYGGMENQTLIAYGSRIQFIRVAGYRINRLLIHELAHEWWGNLISAADWDDFWLHEGFATYMEALYTEHIGGERAYRAYGRRLRRRVKNTQPVVLNRTRTTNEAYDNDVYNKGALTLYALRHAVGDTAFFNMLQQWGISAGPTDARTTKQFMAFAQSYAPRSLKEFFHSFLYTTQSVDTLLPGL
ncbi:MAG: hypothetical protein D6677_04290 [Calditrichaeota bacterium]|nr:MAG: hypothetical protein D6677_04290 [Calditrichota bacterium]